MSSLENIFEDYLLDNDSLLNPYTYKKQILWKDIFDRCPNSHARRTVDFWFPRIKLIVELDGAQHFKPVAFDGNIENSLSKFHSQKNRDQALVDLAAEHSITLITIPFYLKTEINKIAFLNDYILENMNNDE